MVLICPIHFLHTNGATNVPNVDASQPSPSVLMAK
jgi:hypothetical protein